MGFSVLNASGQVKVTADTILGQHGVPGEDGLDAEDRIILLQSSSGGGDVTQAGTNAFTGTDSFANNALNLLVGQIAFPAIQSPSADANTLDDYEEGTWTPVIGGDAGTLGQTYSIQAGAYVKIGQFVCCYGRAQLTVLGTVTGNVQIQGLPFTALNAANQFGGAAIGFFSGLTTSIVFMASRIIINSTAATLGVMTAAATSLSNLAQADLSNSTGLIFAFTYRATA